MSALPFTVEDAGDIIYGAKAGLLHEALALVLIRSSRPRPIVSAFGADDSNRVNLGRYFPAVEPRADKSANVAHLAAYMYWYLNRSPIRRHHMREHFDDCAGGGRGGVGPGRVLRNQFFGERSPSSGAPRDAFGFDVGLWTPEMDRAHGDWCREHFINPSSVKL